MSRPTDVNYQVLATAPNQASKVLLCETPYGTCVLKRWLKDRVAIGGNRSQPLAEYGSLLDLQGIPNINTPLKITLDKEGVDFIYVHCGQNTLQWRAELVDEDDENKDQVAERLAQHVAVHVLKALEEFHKRGLVHRDVKPTNILIRDYPHGGTWLSDMGLTTKAQELSGFVKGLDLQYIPPEYITCSLQQQQQQWHTKDDLQVLASVTTPAADLYQLGLTLYELITGNLPKPLLPPKHSNPKRFSDFLQRVATFNWPRQISRQISNPKVAEVLTALLSSNPECRPVASQVLAEFQWLQEGATLAGQQPWSSNLDQQAAWAAEQQLALKAAGYMELLRLQDEFAAAAAGGGSYGAYSAAGAQPQRGSYDSRGSTPASTPYSTPGSTPYTSPAPLHPTVSTEDSFGSLPSTATATGGPGAWGESAAAAAHKHDAWGLAAHSNAAAAATAAVKLPAADHNWGPAAAATATVQAARSPVRCAASSSSWETPYSSPASVAPKVSAEDSFASYTSVTDDSGSHVRHADIGPAEGHACTGSGWSTAVQSRGWVETSLEGRGTGTAGNEHQQQQQEGW